jgi:hypothetical protein
MCMEHYKRHLPGVAFIFLLMVVASYVGCSGNVSSQEPANYRTGTQGLEMRWAQGNRFTFYEGDDVSLLMELRNRGTAPLYGQLFVTGYDPNFMSLSIFPSQFISLEPKNEFDPTGEFATIATIAANSIRLPNNREKFSQSIQVTACYEYQTLASAEVCVDPDPMNRRIDNKVCQLNAQTPGGQGHPVIISGIQPFVNQQDIRFQIRISNSGGGQVYDKRTSFGKCAVGLNYDEVDLVYVQSVRLAGRPLSCEPLNPVRLLNGQGTINCICRGCIDPMQGAYVSLLEMDLAYNYRQQMTQQINLMALN